MAFMQGDNKYRPRSKKEKLRLEAQRKREKEARRERKKQQQNSPAFVPNYSYPRRNANINISSGPGVSESNKRTNLEVEYNEEMLAREKAAQEEAERRKKCVAPAYNKGAYQPVFTKDQAKWIGR